jgi:transposase
MGKAKRLTDAEIQIIKSFNKQGDSNRQIASKIGRSEAVMRNLLKKVINME